jgi:hypothetical protein
MNRSCGDQALGIVVIRIHQEAHHRHRVIGLVLDIGQDKHAGLLGRGRNDASQIQYDEEYKTSDLALHHAEGSGVV